MPRKMFTGKTIRIDGKAFIDTDFIGCTFLYSGTKGVKFRGCKFKDPRFFFDGPAANTMNFLSGLYGGGAATVVERAFEEIRRSAPVSAAYN